MKWTEPKPPIKGVGHYDHIFCETPLGVLKIEWKSWKGNPSYDVSMNDIDWIGCEYDLESAKKIAQDYIIGKHKELSDFLQINQ